MAGWLAAAGAAFPQESDTTSKDLPFVRPMHGKLAVWKAGSKKVFSVDKELRLDPQDRIGSADGEMVQFASEGDVLLTLRGVRPGSDDGVSFERGPKALIIKILKGSVVVETLERNVELRTPQATLRGNQAHFIIDVTGGATHVVVVDGTLAVTTDMGTAKVEGGRATKAERGKKPQDPKPVDLEKALESYSAFEQNSNLVLNPGFEEGLTHWAPEPHQNKLRVFADSKTVHSGRRSARVVSSSDLYGPAPLGTTWSGMKSVFISVEAKKRYFARAFMRMEALRGSAKAHFRTGGSTQGGSWLSETGQWKMVRFFFTAREPQILLSLDIVPEGETYDVAVYMDDVFVAEVGADPTR